jgi:hypothetical protein
LARQADVVVNVSEIGVGLVPSWIATRLARKPLIIAVHADLDAALNEWILDKSIHSFIGYIATWPVPSVFPQISSRR